MDPALSVAKARRFPRIVGVRDTGRFLLPLLGGGLVGLLTWLASKLPPPSTCDVDQLWLGARALLHGENPYVAVARSNATGYPLFYPLPAVLALVPLAWMPLELARAVWAAIGTTILIVAARHYGRGLPVVFLSAGFLQAALLGQWSPFLTAGAVLPWAAVAWSAKPSIGAAVAAGYASRWTAAACAAVVAVSIAILPSWPQDWLTALGSAEHVAPVFRPGGFLLLLALLRWRMPEARVLAALACVPQMSGLYETVPLFLVPQTRSEGYLLAALSYGAAFLGGMLEPRTSTMSLEATMAARWPFLLMCMYLPALALLFRRRRNAPPSPMAADRSSP